MIEVRISTLLIEQFLTKGNTQDKTRILEGLPPGVHFKSVRPSRDRPDVIRLVFDDGKPEVIEQQIVIQRESIGFGQIVVEREDLNNLLYLAGTSHANFDDQDRALTHKLRQLLDDNQAGVAADG